MSSAAGSGHGDTVIRGATLINEGSRTEQDILIRGERIEQIGGSPRARRGATEIEAGGKWLLPGLIDDQVHFREPGPTHKGDMATESAAAVAGGVTSFMDMPNVAPATVTRERLAAKYAAAANRAHANFAFYLGATETNLEEIQALDGSEACGVKVFMGTSTGNLLVEDPDALEGVFANCRVLIATHCEDSPVIERNLERARRKYGEDIPPRAHPEIRDAECCYRSSSMAVGLAKKHGAKLHVLHLTTARELKLFDPWPDLTARDSITAEVCVHHLWFSDGDYAELGNRIKCNPAIKAETDRKALRAALREGRLSLIATDHAPHTAEEKSGDYLSAPAGLPLVQHSLLMLLDLAHAGHLTVERAVQAACHAPAQLYGIAERGFLREGYFADCVLVDPGGGHTVSSENVRYKCGWSPLEGHRFSARIDTTFVNGAVAWKDGELSGAPSGQALVCNSRGGS